MFALEAQGLSKRYTPKDQPPVQALEDISLSVPSGALSALVGPDGAGKTTFLRLAAGLLRADAGTLRVVGLDVAAQPQAVQDRIGYMPQRFGLYEDLSVQENLDLYADLHGVAAADRTTRYAQLMEMTNLGPFRDRLAGKLSGGMKQKLGLACTLVRTPDLLLLDEPTVGVDPLSRRELWEIVSSLVSTQKLTVIVSTTYLDEAEECARVFVFREGRLLTDTTPPELRDRATGLVHVVAPPDGVRPRELQARLIDAHAQVIDAVPAAGEVRFVLRQGVEASSLRSLIGDAAAPRSVAPRLEDGFMRLLADQATAPPATPSPAAVAATPAAGTAGATGSPTASGETVIEVRDLVRRFGDFTAVANTNFEVHRGEIFGLLGPNGAGKTTTFRMLCGLLPATSGFLRVAGVDLRHARAQARGRIGYVAQKFALYGDLTVLENLQFFGGAYGLRGERLAQRIDAVLGQFDLGGQRKRRARDLPGGFRQRLAMSAALLHEPGILFLDEPTSGADPFARREFWRRITSLSAGGVTIVVTTHFMEEAEYCDRIVIQDAGKVLAIGTPREVRERAGSGAANMDDAFVAIVERARSGQGQAREVA